MYYISLLTLISLTGYKLVSFSLIFPSCQDCLSYLPSIKNIRFIHGFEVFIICWRPRSILMPDAKPGGINVDRGSQQTLNTEDLWLNVIITHSKYISSPFISLFSTVIPIFSPSFSLLYWDYTGKSAHFCTETMPEYVIMCIILSCWVNTWVFITNSLHDHGKFYLLHPAFYEGCIQSWWKLKSRLFQQEMEINRLLRLMYTLWFCLHIFSQLVCALLYMVTV